MIAMDILDRRTMWRDYWIEWAIAALFIALAELAQWRIAGLLGRGSAVQHHGRPVDPGRDPLLPGRRLPRVPPRSLEARPMKASRFTAAHQSITFSRRMMLVGGAQAAFGGVLVARLGYLSIAQNEHYQLLVARATGSS